MSVRKAGVLGGVAMALLWWNCSQAQVGIIEGTVSYHENITRSVYVGAFDSPCGGNYGEPDYGTVEVITGSGPYAINSYMGEYYVCAFMDMDGSGPPFDPSTDPFGAYPGKVEVFPNDQVTGNIDIVLQDPNAIPALSSWGAAALALVLGGGAFFFVRRRRRALQADPFQP